MMFSSCYHLYVFIFLFECSVHAVTESGPTPTSPSNLSSSELFSSVAPTLRIDPENLSSTLSVFEESTTKLNGSEFNVPTATVLPETPAPVCLCDLTPGFCDIGCCCDTNDCGVTDLSTVFSDCTQPKKSGVCIEKWLMFKANVNTSLYTVTDSLFCVQSEDAAPKFSPLQARFPALGNSYHFSPSKQTNIKQTGLFYKVDDAVQTYFFKSSVHSVLWQPSPGALSTTCMNRNPAKFLRSTSLSCTQSVTSQTCTAASNLNAQSYFSDLSLFKVPTKTEISPDNVIPVTALANWPAPTRRNNVCVNVVKKVQFVIGYTSQGDLTYSSVNITLVDVDLDQLLLQTHSVLFELATPKPSPEDLTPPVGFKVGSPLISITDGKIQPLTSLGLFRGGECSAVPSERARIRFMYNIISGCTFRSPASNCLELRSQIYEILQGPYAPDMIAMNSGSASDWTRVLLKECAVRPEETCETGCVLPVSLSIQILWARHGSIELPQNIILGAKYQYQCQTVTCPLLSSLALTSRVAFAETTMYPETPRGLPQPHWKFPFGFFSRGRAELDGC